MTYIAEIKLCKKTKSDHKHSAQKQSIEKRAIIKYVCVYICSLNYYYRLVRKSRRAGRRYTRWKQLYTKY